MALFIRILMMSMDIGSATLRRLDYTVIGDVVNTAKRLHETAEASHILITGTSYEQIKESSSCAMVKTVQLKNKTNPVTIYEVLVACTSFDCCRLASADFQDQMVVSFAWIGSTYFPNRQAFGKIRHSSCTLNRLILPVNQKTAIFRLKMIL